MKKNTSIVLLLLVAISITAHVSADTLPLLDHFVFLPIVLVPTCDCSGNIYNCSDFATQADAQACFNYCVAQGHGDIHRLDADSDGVACENLPMPMPTNTPTSTPKPTLTLTPIITVTLTVASVSSPTPTLPPTWTVAASTPGAGTQLTSTPPAP